MSEYGMSFEYFKELIDVMPVFKESDLSDVLRKELQKPIHVLDLSNWQKDALASIGMNSIKDILQASEEKLRTAHYVGEKRARRMRSAALASVYEYLNG